MIIDCALYVTGRRVPGDLALTDVVSRARADADAFSWIGLYEPTDEEFATVRAAFDLHPLAVEDAIKAHQRPKVERYGDSLFVVMKTARYVGDIVDVGEIMVFAGADFVVTVRHGESDALAGARRRLEAEPRQLCRGAPAVLHATADEVVDDYADVLAALEREVEAVEAAVFSPSDANVAARIYRLKRELHAFRRVVVPLVDAAGQLAAEPLLARDGNLHEYFRDVHDHVVRAEERVAALDELLSSALGANLAQITVRQNEDMRRISAWVGMVAVPTMIAGIYGMNFRYMPELEWRYGYFAVLAVIAVAVTVLYRLFKRSGWL